MPRASINFRGRPVTVTDDAVNNRLDVTVHDHEWVAEHHGMVLWNFDVGRITVGSTTALTSLVPQLEKVPVPRNVTIVGLYTNTSSTAAATLTAGSNRVGVFSSAGALLNQSADVTAWAANSVNPVALAAPVAITGGPNVFVWLARLISAGTMPGILRASVSTPASLNVGLTAATARCGRLAAVASGAGLPTSFNPATDLTLHDPATWIGAY